MAEAFNRLKREQIRESIHDADRQELALLMSEFRQGGLLKFLKVRKEDGTIFHICGRRRRDGNYFCAQVFHCPMEVFGHTDKKCEECEVKYFLPRSNLRIQTRYAAPVLKADGNPLCGIIRGEKSQLGYDGAPCTGMALSFFKFALSEQVLYFTVETMTNILDFGSKMYQVCRERLRAARGVEPPDMLTVFEMRGDYPYRNGSSSFRVEVCENADLDLDGSMEDHSKFQNSIKKFLRPEEGSFAVITTNSQSMGIVKEGDFLFMFDSHARGEEGGVNCSTLSNSRKSCLVIFDKTNVSQCSLNVLYHFQSNLKFTKGDYSVSPVSASITPNPY